MAMQTPRFLPAAQADHPPSTVTMPLEPVYLDMENAVIAQLTLSRLTGEIKKHAHLLEKKRHQRQKRLMTINNQIECLFNKRLKDKFDVDASKGKSSTAISSHLAQINNNNDHTRPIPVCRLIKNECTVQRLIKEAEQIHAIDKQEAENLDALYHQLQRCQAYVTAELPCC